MKDNLSYLLSTIEFTSNLETGHRTLDQCSDEIFKEQPKWQKYLEQQNTLMKEAIKTFKTYDKARDLKYFWPMLKIKIIGFNNDIFEQLIKIALLAYDRGTLEDAYKMFSFISMHFPMHYKVYLYLGTVIQSLYGPEEAAPFFKTITSVFAEPELLFLAAENEVQRENISDAMDYLQKAENILSTQNNLTEEENELKTRIEELLNLLK